MVDCSLYGGLSVVARRGTHTQSVPRYREPKTLSSVVGLCVNNNILRVKSQVVFTAVCVCECVCGFSLRHHTVASRNKREIRQVIYIYIYIHTFCTRWRRRRNCMFMVDVCFLCVIVCVFYADNRVV